MECKYALMSFGIPTSAFPPTPDDGFLVDQFNQWIENQRRLDEMRKSSETSSSIAGLFHSSLDTEDARFSSDHCSSTCLVSPSMPLSLDRHDTPEIKVEVEAMTRDILLGRGKPLQRHPGNVRFRELIACHAGKYELGDRFQKTVIAADVVATIRESDGRFLKPYGEGGWGEIDDNTARLKVAHTFRTLRKYKKKYPQGSW
jgi:hypothetical protein